MKITLVKCKQSIFYCKQLILNAIRPTADSWLGQQPRRVMSCKLFIILG